MGAAGMLLLAGCSSPEPEFQFDDLGLLPTQEELVEFPLGHFAIPIPSIDDYGEKKRVPRNRLEFEFELHALVTPKHEAQLTDQWQRHEGKVRDQIIQVCRNASMDDLREVELTSLKSHMIDAVQAVLGSKYIRRLLITNVISQEL